MMNAVYATQNDAKVNHFSESCSTEAKENKGKKNTFPSILLP